MGEEASAAEIIQLDSSSPEAPSVPPDVVMIEDDAGGEPAGARAAEEGEGAPEAAENLDDIDGCLLYTSPSPRDGLLSRMPSSA